MKLREIAELLECNVVSGESQLDRDITHVFASDLMSDVLTIETDNLLLLTGLTNIQTIRTSEMADISNIILVRNKHANEEMVKLANENNIAIMECPYSMFRACGILYKAGLLPVY